MLLVFALLMGSVPGALQAAAETPDGNAASETAATETPDGNAASETGAGTDTIGLSQVGQVINGFETLETRDFPLMDATVVRFAHQKTGAELYYIANDDTNRVFDLTFKTEANDKTGLPQVFEHAVLSGSEKYPSTQLFSNLKHQTYNTYMNALTYSEYHLSGGEPVGGTAFEICGFLY